MSLEESKTGSEIVQTPLTDFPLSEEKRWSEPDLTLIPNEKHEWKQQGPYIICRSCPFEHAHWVGNEKVLVGIDDKGEPIIRLKEYH